MIMATVVKPWQSSNIPGPTMANVMTPEVAGNMIKRAKKPLLIIGNELTNAEEGGDRALPLIVKLGQSGIPIVATATTLRDLKAQGFEGAYPMGVVEITNRLRDHGWQGLDGKGNYDLVIYVGVMYPLESQVLANLKHFSEKMRTMTLDRFYHPNADWSFNNVKVDDWVKGLETVTKMLVGA